MSAIKTTQARRKEKKLTTRKMVMAGVFGAISVVLGVTGLGMIPVPNLAGYATIMHLPVIIAAVLEGPLVGAFTGLIMGIYSLMTPAGIAPDPIVCVIPRVLIGVVSGFVYMAVGKRHPQIGAALAGILGTCTNTVGFIGLAVLLGYVPGAIWLTIVPQAIVELILATVLTVIIVRIIQRSMPQYRNK
ncbi:MAG: ECF transporter S component [Peptococcaceae bacterium]|nr:ECF transporter S component [Peptococcaceae bacterium]